VKAARSPTQISRVIDALREGPCTSSEVSAITGLPRKHCCAHLRELWGMGLVTRKVMHPAPGVTGQRPHLYSLVVSP